MSRRVMNQGFKGICGSDLGKVGELAPIGGGLLSLSELGAHCVWVISQPLGFSNEPWTCRRRLLLESGDEMSRVVEVLLRLYFGVQRLMRVPSLFPPQPGCWVQASA